MRKVLLGVFILLLVAFNITLAVSSYAEPNEGSQIVKPTITISLDLIECTPEKLAEYGLKFPSSLTEVQSSEIQADKDIRDKLSRLKKDKDIKIVYSTKVTTYPGNKVIVDNRQPLEYLVPEEDGTTFKKEIKYTGNFFEVNPTITKDGNISFDYHFWVGELKGRFSNNKDIPQELGYPMFNVSSSNSCARLNDGETIIVSGISKKDEIWTNHEGVMTKREERKARICCLGADIDKSPSPPE